MPSAENATTMSNYTIARWAKGTHHSPPALTTKPVLTCTIITCILLKSPICSYTQISNKTLLDKQATIGISMLLICSQKHLANYQNVCAQNNILEIWVYRHASRSWVNNIWHLSPYIWRTGSCNYMAKQIPEVMNYQCKYTNLKCLHSKLSITCL